MGDCGWMHALLHGVGVRPPIIIQFPLSPVTVDLFSWLFPLLGCGCSSALGSG